jgi:hypothetical protein
LTDRIIALVENSTAATDFSFSYTISRYTIFRNKVRKKLLADIKHQKGKRTRARKKRAENKQKLLRERLLTKAYEPLTGGIYVGLSSDAFVDYTGSKVKHYQSTRSETGCSCLFGGPAHIYDKDVEEHHRYCPLYDLAATVHAPPATPVYWENGVNTLALGYANELISLFAVRWYTVYGVNRFASLSERKKILRWASGKDLTRQSKVLVTLD